MKYLLLILLLCGCEQSKTDKYGVFNGKAKYEQNENGYVFYIDAICFDYPYGYESFHIFRDGTTREMIKKGIRHIDWDNANSFCKDYFNKRKEAK